MFCALAHVHHHGIGRLYKFSMLLKSMDLVCDAVQGLVCPVLLKIIMKKKIYISNDYLLTRMHSVLETLCSATLKRGEVSCSHAVVLLD